MSAKTLSTKDIEKLFDNNFKGLNLENLMNEIINSDLNQGDFGSKQFIYLNDESNIQNYYHEVKAKKETNLGYEDYLLLLKLIGKNVDEDMGYLTSDEYFTSGMGLNPQAYPNSFAIKDAIDNLYSIYEALESKKDLSTFTKIVEKVMNEDKKIG